MAPPRRESTSFRRILAVPSERALAIFLGAGDETIRTIETRLPVRVFVRSGEVRIAGEDEGLVERTASLIAQFLDQATRGRAPEPMELRAALERLREGEREDLASRAEEVVCTSSRGKTVRPCTEGQRAYVQAISDRRAPARPTWP